MFGVRRRVAAGTAGAEAVTEEQEYQKHGDNNSGHRLWASVSRFAEGGHRDSPVVGKNAAVLLSRRGRKPHGDVQEVLPPP